MIGVGIERREDWRIAEDIEQWRPIAEHGAALGAVAGLAAMLVEAYQEILRLRGKFGGIGDAALFPPGGLSLSVGAGVCAGRDSGGDYAGVDRKGGASKRD